MTEKTFVPFDMDIDDADHHWSAFTKALAQIGAEFSADEYQETASAIRKYADSAEGTLEQFKADQKNTISPKVQAFAFVLADLIDQRWNFELSKNHGECFGTYVLSKIKGTWSILCDYNNMNASGTLVWNDTTGEVNGIGKDEKNKRVKFTVKKQD